MTAVDYLNLSMEIWGCIMCGVVVLCLMFAGRPQDKIEKFYLRMLWCNTGSLLFDALELLFRGRPGPLCRWGMRLSGLLASAFGFALLAAFSRYLAACLGRRTAVSQKPLLFVRIVCGASVLLMILNQFVPVVSFFDAQNAVHRADLFWLPYLTALAGLALNAGMLLRSRGALKRREFAAFWNFLLLPAAALCAQLFFQDLSLVNLANTVTLVAMIVFLHAEQGRQAAEREHFAAEQAQRVAEQEIQLMKSRVAIMLSQIQPHFLYNALAAIQDLCHGKAPEAEQATVQFSEFLRGNLDSLQADEPIPFAQELKHTQNYLWLEQQRFGARLRVEYDIRTEAFRIPALTLQPIVENAVRYGVTKKERGGTVRISACETEDAFRITVEDDGTGFDAYAPKPDGRTHIGISNVGDRLRAMCGGSLNIRSIPEHGTSAVIAIPKEKRP